jgi:hypothetical protein
MEQLLFGKQRSYNHSCFRHVLTCAIHMPRNPHDFEKKQYIRLRFPPISIPLPYQMARTFLSWPLNLYSYEIGSRELGPAFIWDFRSFATLCLFAIWQAIVITLWVSGESQDLSSSINGRKGPCRNTKKSLCQDHLVSVQLSQVPPNWPYWAKKKRAELEFPACRQIEANIWDYM